MWFNKLILSFFLTHFFKGNIGQYLIGIHVSGSTSTTLIQVCKELIMILSINHILTSFFNSIHSIFLHSTYFRISTSCSQFYDGICFYVVRIKICFYSADLEILKRPERLYSIIGIERNLFFTKQVFFSARFRCLFYRLFLRLRVWYAAEQH